MTKKYREIMKTGVMTKSLMIRGVSGGKEVKENMTDDELYDLAKWLCTEITYYESDK